MTLASAVDIPLPEGVSESQVICRFSVPGEPVPKGRPRFDPRSGHVYTPDVTSTAEARVLQYLKMAHPRIKPCADYVGIWYRFYLKGTGRGDTDNYEKLVSDSLQPIVFLNDKQIRDSWVQLIDNSRQPRSDILVYRLVSRLL